MLTERASTDGRYAVRITAPIMERLVHLCASSGDLETGGILVGHYDDGCRVACVTTVSGPSRGSRRGRWSFERAVGGLQRWLDRLWRARRAYYLGEWHFHPGHSPQPSRIDCVQMAAIADDPQYSCPEPLLAIVGGRVPGPWSMSVTVFVRGGRIVPLAGDVVPQDDVCEESDPRELTVDALIPRGAEPLGVCADEVYLDGAGDRDVLRRMSS